MTLKLSTTSGLISRVGKTEKKKETDRQRERERGDRKRERHTERERERQNFKKEIKDSKTRMNGQICYLKDSSVSSRVLSEFIKNFLVILDPNKEFC